ncbi:hypothetical protein C8R41DRAFT_983357 [Lentinula lateritia]|uniref:F-box domain-containing protein n=1 Tax=Lentinula lateritia TaxID=40482 RepID=A0ABQ8V6Z8_9AGAR|nr:hypothetical protein C8R41DRAFT_983357 [Lentinula lateritia]
MKRDSIHIKLSMARRSARIQEKNAANLSHDANDIQISFAEVGHEKREVEDQELSEDDRPRKRAKRPEEGNQKKKKRAVPKSFRKVRGRLGLLERLVKDVPLEVSLEIFCYLEPRDLLRLSRTSHELRNILMSKSSEDIWRAARQNLKGDLQPPPPDLNEPQYAYIMFEPFCHVCDRRVENVFWSFRMRCCKECALDLFAVYDPTDYPEEFQASNILLRERIDTGDRIISIHQGETGARLKAQFQALQSREERDSWLNRKVEERKQLYNHAVRCTRWSSFRILARMQELDAIRKQRKEDILVRLEKIGWREEAEILMVKQSYPPGSRRNAFSQHKLVKQSKKLTDYGWNAIKDELVKILSDHKKERSKSAE